MTLHYITYIQPSIRPPTPTETHTFHSVPFHSTPLHSIPLHYVHTCTVHAYIYRILKTLSQSFPVTFVSLRHCCAQADASVTFACHHGSSAKIWIYKGPRLSKGSLTSPNSYVLGLKKKKYGLRSSYHGNPSFIGICIYMYIYVYI